MLEQVRNSVFDDLSGGTKKTRIYLQVKIDDLEILVTKTSSLIHDNKDKHHNSATERRNVVVGCESKVSEEENRCKSSNCESQEKSLMKKDSNEPMGDHGLTSRASLTTCAVPDTTQVFMCKALFLVRHRENLVLKKKQKVFYACAVDIKVIAISSCEQVEQDDHAPCSSDLTQLSVKTKSIVLRLQHQNIFWYPFLRDGCFYILEERSSSNNSSSITKAMNYSSKPLLDVTSSMDIKQVFPARHFRKEVNQTVAKAMEQAEERFLCDADDKLRTIEAILTSSKSESEQKDKAM